MDFDPRDRDNDSRDIEMRWVDLEQRAGFDHDVRDALDRDRDDVRGRDRDGRDRDVDPRDVFVHGLDLPRGRDRELVLDGRDLYELNRDDSRSLAIVGAFRAVPERDLGDTRDNTVGHLRDEGLVRVLSLDGRDRVVTLTSRGRHLLDAHRLERDGRREQTFYAGVSRLREISHDSQLYRAYLRTAERLREQGADLRRVVLDHELKRDYQQWLQAHNRGRADSDGRPGRDPREVERWAEEHELPYVDRSVHFPDFRIEYERNGLERYEDVEVITPHYRGAHAASRARSGFTCVGGSGRRGGSTVDPDFARDFL